MGGERTLRGGCTPNADPSFCPSCPLDRLLLLIPRELRGEYGGGTGGAVLSVIPCAPPPTSISSLSP